MPDAIVLAGVNGAGKTTFARWLLPPMYPAASFLNGDEIQREAPAFAHPVAAGREMLRRLTEVEERRASFAVETTLSSVRYARRMRLWRSSGYRIALHFIELPSEDYAVQRVANRVAAGGHPVAEADIRRRFRRSVPLFHQVYQPLVDEWHHWLSDDQGLRLASSKDDNPSQVKLPLLLAAARQATKEALHGPAPLRAGRYQPPPAGG